MVATKVRPVYFGSSSRPLFGVHDAPRSASTTTAGTGGAVLLCYPGVQEYGMAHWAFRRLSAMLAREGFHVLRFDWSGTGDSWGETADGTVEIWLEDVALARRELLDASGASALSVVGMRLGATLAWLACSEGAEAESLVLWEPVVTGKGYLADLAELDAKENTRLLRDPRPRDPRAPHDELMGFPFPDALRTSLEGLDLRAAPAPHAKQIALVTSVDRPHHHELRARLSRSGATATYDCVPEDPSATNAGEREAALLATASLAVITERLAGRDPW